VHVSSWILPEYSPIPFIFIRLILLLFDHDLVSGNPPEDPVVSLKSGHVFERRLVEKYIQEKGSDPVTGESISMEELKSVKLSKHGVTAHFG
jgi:hypothetical protein